ncbi:SH3 domain-containing protein [Aquimarina sp. AU58]|uniref:SH3 domain-containing protein n=1 Tax=Aquimarina sp. AU58 TaxID=1874112 RepID=UPI000D6E2C4F|nr:SH3 domain-containing protein [Aquimarina sp. AU58]
MKKVRILFFLVVIMVNLGYGKIEGNTGLYTLTTNDTTLVITGNNIWVREYPKTGEVVFTLNDGAVCRVLEKGEEQIIRGNKDFWYKIEHSGKIGWVFGSQTSIKQNADFKNFEPFLEYFLQTSFFGKKIDSLIHFRAPMIIDFIHKDIGFYRLYNPGAACVLNQSYDNYSAIMPKVDIPVFFAEELPKEGFCEKSPGPDGVYYKRIDSLPRYLEMDEVFEMEKIDIPSNYKDGLKVKVNVVDKKWIIKTMYFIVADNKWWLVVIDDCDCSA